MTDGNGGTAGNFALSPEFLARYQIQEIIGRGGMGAVYRAKQTGTGRDVAIKFMAGNLFEGDDTEARFMNEAKTLAALQHPNLVQVLDAGKDGAVPFIVFEFVSGSTVKKEVETRGRIPVYEALRIARDLLQALRAAHEKGVIHRDIKSENILIDDQGRVKVLDFGIAKSDNTQQTRTGVIVGTPAYMAPEQAMNRKLDARTDLYSAGVVLYELITGRLPFGDENSMVTMMAHINEPVPAPSFLFPGLPGLVDELLAGALAKAPEERYPTARAFEIALQHAEDKLRRIGYQDGSSSSPAQDPSAGIPETASGIHRRTGMTAGAPNGAAAGGTTATSLPGTAGATLGGSVSATRATHLGGTAARLESSGTFATSRTHATALSQAQRTLGGPGTLGATSPTGFGTSSAALRISRPPPGPSPGQRAGMAAAGLAALVAVGLGVRSWLGPSTRSETKTSADLSSLMETLGRIETALDPARRKPLLRFDLPERVLPGRDDLRQKAIEELDRIRTTMADLDPLGDQPFLAALSSIGVSDSYFVLLEDLEKVQHGDLEMVLQALHQGLDRGFFPPDHRVDELVGLLLRHEHAATGSPALCRTFFDLLGFLGGDLALGRLRDLLAPGSRDASKTWIQVDASRALGMISRSDRPGQARAAEMLVGSAPGAEDAAVDLRVGDLLDRVDDASQGFRKLPERRP